MLRRQMHHVVTFACWGLHRIPVFLRKTLHHAKNCIFIHFLYLFEVFMQQVPFSSVRHLNGVIFEKNCLSGLCFMGRMVGMSCIWSQVCTRFNIPVGQSVCGCFTVWVSEWTESNTVQTNFLFHCGKHKIHIFICSSRKNSQIAGAE